MDELLVGVDGSPDSRNALRWAASMARALDLPLRVVGAWQYPADTAFEIGGIDLPKPREADQAIETALTNLLSEELEPDDIGRTKIDVRRGPAARALLEAAKGRGTMVIVGSRGLGGFRGLLLGSVGRQLSEHSEVPLTIVRRDTAAREGLRRIVVGVDGSAHAARALEFASTIAAKADAELIVTNVVIDPFEISPPPGIDAPLAFDAPPTSAVTYDTQERFEAVERWCEPLKAAGVRHRIELEQGDARSTLLDVARRVDADLLVVGSRGLGRTRRMLLGSVASSLAQNSDLPVTIVRRAP